VTSNEFTSCVISFIVRKLNTHKYKEFILISDGCNYQNRNKVLSSALSDLAVQKNIKIEQLILEKGHTMMEADSVHSVLVHLFQPQLSSGLYSKDEAREILS